MKTGAGWCCISLCIKKLPFIKFDLDQYKTLKLFIAEVTRKRGTDLQKAQGQEDQGQGLPDLQLLTETFLAVVNMRVFLD